MSSKRDAAKARRRMRKQARRSRVKRDMWVTAKYGESGHRQCGKKVRYPTKETALARASKYVVQGAPALRTYKCPFCDGWHLTSRPEGAYRKTGGESKEDGGYEMGSKDYRVHEATRRAAAIDARLGMEVADIARGLGISADVVERSISEFAYLTDEELGMGGPEGDSADDDAVLVQTPTTMLAGTFWAIVEPLGEPLALFSRKDVAEAACRMLNVLAQRAVDSSLKAHVSSVEAYDTLWGDANASR